LLPPGQKHELGAASPFQAAVVYCDM
jgi:hypothetical protein